MDMSDFKYPNLFKPIILAGAVFRNRIFAAPTGYMDNGRFGDMPPEAAYYFERKAKGGVAAVTLGECKVDSKFGCSSQSSTHLDDPLARNSFCRVVDAVRRQGAVCSAELSHSGNRANRNYDPPGIAYGPVDGVDEGFPFYEMPEDVIWYTIEKYAKCAALAKSYGFGMVTLHAGHGWFISQFLSEALNTRKDKWGGPDIENRARLVVEILKAIRKAVGPAFPVEVRISGSECYDGGYGIEEGIKIAKQVEPYLDLLHVSTGSHEVEEVFTVTHPSMFLPDGCNVQYAEEIKKHVNCPVATVGALGNPDLMEDIIASGKADVVEIARGLIADPEIPRKIRTGRGDDINVCMRCLHCFSNLHMTGQFYCAINPEIGREAEMNLAIPPAVRKKVLIAGGGVAGMQAAITCAERGHDVVLCEKTNRLGGVLRCEELVPFKARLTGYLDHQAYMLSKSKAEIYLNTLVTPELAEEIAPDVIIAAVGARPVIPDFIKGWDRPNVFGAEDIYLEPEKAGKKIAVLGGGLVGLELAVFMAMSGREVTVIEMQPELNDGGNNMHGLALGGEIEKYGIKISVASKAVEINENGVSVEFTGEPLPPKKASPFNLPQYQPIAVTGGLLFEADTVVYAIGQKPLWDEALSLRKCAPEFHQIGDCVAPRNIMNATHTGFTAAYDIGVL